MNVKQEGMNAVGDWVSKALQRLTPRCAEGANSIADPFIQGARYARQDGSKSWGEFAETMFGGQEGDLTSFKVGDRRLNGAKIGAAGVGLGIGYRGISGGGLYRDKDGNTDIAGIPFI